MKEANSFSAYSAVDFNAVVVSQVKIAMEIFYIQEQCFK